MFEFAKYKDAADNELFREVRLFATTSQPLYFGQALKITAGRLCYAQTGDLVYAICGVSAASSVVTANYKPEVFPINNRQIWKASLGTAVTAATSTILGGYGILNVAADFGTSIDGNNVISYGTAVTALAGGFMLYDVVTGSSPSTSAAYVIFKTII